MYDKPNTCPTMASSIFWKKNAWWLLLDIFNYVPKLMLKNDLCTHPTLVQTYEKIIFTWIITKSWLIIFVMYFCYLSTYLPNYLTTYVTNYFSTYQAFTYLLDYLFKYLPTYLGMHLCTYLKYQGTLAIYLCRDLLNYLSSLCGYRCTLIHIWG
jgi:hypothetical protein